MSVMNISVGSGTMGVAYDRAKGEIYVADDGSDYVSIICDGSVPACGPANSVIGKVDVGAVSTGATYDSAKGEVFVSSTLSGYDYVSIICDGSFPSCGTANSVVTKVNVGEGSIQVVYDPVEGEVFVANQNSHNVSVINDTTDSVVATVPLYMDIWGLAYDQAEGEVFVAVSGSDYLSIICDGSVPSCGIANTVATTVQVGVSPLVVVVDTGLGEVIASNQDSKYVSVICDGSVPACGTANSLVASVNVGAGSFGIAYDNDTGEIFVGYSSEVCVISDSTNRVVANLHVGQGTYHQSVYDPSNGDVYVSNSAQGILSVINGIRPAIASFTANPSPTDVGSDTTIVASASGGLGYLSYNYTGLPTGCSSSNVTIIVCSPTKAGTFTIGVYVNDSLKSSATSILSLTVNVDPTISSFMAARNPIDINATEWFNVSASGGTGALSYAYTDLPPGCAASDTNSLSCVPAGLGAFTVKVFVNDSTTLPYSVNRTLSLTVEADPAISTFTAARSPTDSNVAEWFNVTASGGTGVLSYVYTGLPSGCATSDKKSLACTPTESGTFTVTVFVNDSAAPPYSVNSTLSLTVNADPAISSFVAARSPTDTNVAEWFNVTASGGTGALSYVYTGLPSGCATSDKKSLACTPTESGTFTVTVFVNDSAAPPYSVNSTLSLTVNADPAISSFVAARSPTDTNVAEWFNVTASGGTVALSYVYVGLPPGCVTSDRKLLVCTPTGTGTFAVTVFVSDSAIPSYTVNRTLPLIVNADPTISSFAVARNPSDANLAEWFNVSASGGTGTLSYSYTGLPPGCGSFDVNSLACNPTAGGAFTVRVYVNDSAGMSATTTLSLTVTIDPLIESFIASPNPIGVGSSTVLTVSSSGGAQPLTYTYAGLPSGCSSTDTPTLSCKPTVAGSYTIRVFVNDSRGQSVTATTLLTVNSNSSSQSFPWWMWLVIALAIVVALVAVFIVVLARRRHNDRGKHAYDREAPSPAEDHAEPEGDDPDAEVMDALPKQPKE
jgi:YVTN family beta-propeller protein